MRRGSAGEKGEREDFLCWQPVNRLMGERLAMSWYLSGWEERARERHTKWHSDGFLTAFFLLGPILCHVTGHLFIYLPHFMIPQIASISLLMVRLHCTRSRASPRATFDDWKRVNRWYYRNENIIYYNISRWGQWAAILLKRNFWANILHCFGPHWNIIITNGWFSNPRKASDLHVWEKFLANLWMDAH